MLRICCGTLCCNLGDTAILGDVTATRSSSRLAGLLILNEGSGARPHRDSATLLAERSCSKPAVLGGHPTSNPDGQVGSEFLHASAPWYQFGIMQVMGMTLRTSDEQTEALRRQAAAEGRSMQAVALSAIDEYIARRAHKAGVAAALQRVVCEEAGVLERLKDA